MLEDYSRRSKTRMAHKIWKQSIPIIGSIADNYFQERGIMYDPEYMGEIRFNPAVLHEPTEEKLPAIIAPVHNLNGAFVGIYKTYLSPDGAGRAFVDGNACRMLGDCHGSYIQFCKSSSFRLVIAESIESALAIQQACPGLQVWAAMSPSNMRSLVPPSVREIILCADDSDLNKEANAKWVKAAVREQLGRGMRVSLAPRLSGMTFSEIL